MFEPKLESDVFESGEFFRDDSGFGGEMAQEGGVSGCSHFLDGQEGLAHGLGEEGGLLEEAEDGVIELVVARAKIRELGEGSAQVGTEALEEFVAKVRVDLEEKD